MAPEETRRTPRTCRSTWPVPEVMVLSHSRHEEACTGLGCPASQKTAITLGPVPEGSSSPVCPPSAFLAA